MANLIAWAKTVVGRYIDVDQWEGNQCWDLAQAWLTACNGGTLWTQPSRYPGLAAGSWEVATQNTANTADLLRHVTPIPGTERGQPGDIVIFAYGSPDYPISHTAVLIEDRGPILSTLSQNSSPPRPDLPGYSVKSSGPTIYQDLPRAGILGFLRPRATITGQSSNIEPIQEDDMPTAEEIADAVWSKEITLKNGETARAIDHFVNLCEDAQQAVKIDQVLTGTDGTQARVMDIMANLGPDVRAIKTVTDKAKQ